MRSYDIVPYDDDYQTCERTYVSFRILTGDRSPDWVIEKLQMTPSAIRRKGEQKETRHGFRTVRVNGWYLRSENVVESKDVRRHLDWLIEQLWPHRAALYVVQEDPQVKMNVNCVWWSAHGHGGPALWPEHMAALAEMRLELAFDVYCINEFEPGELVVSK